MSELLMKAKKAKEAVSDMLTKSTAQKMKRSGLLPVN